MHLWFGAIAFVFGNLITLQNPVRVRPYKRQLAHRRPAWKSKGTTVHVWSRNNRLHFWKPYHTPWGMGKVIHYRDALHTGTPCTQMPIQPGRARAHRYTFGLGAYRWFFCSSLITPKVLVRVRHYTGHVAHRCPTWKSKAGHTSTRVVSKQSHVLMAT